VFNLTTRDITSLTNNFTSIDKVEIPISQNTNNSNIKTEINETVLKTKLYDKYKTQLKQFLT
jgi:hypothetical protein